MRYSGLREELGSIDSDDYRTMAYMDTAFDGLSSVRLIYVDTVLVTTVTGCPMSRYMPVRQPSM